MRATTEPCCMRTWRRTGRPLRGWSRWAGCMLETWAGSDWALEVWRKAIEGLAQVGGHVLPETWQAPCILLGFRMIDRTKSPGAMQNSSGLQQRIANHKVQMHATRSPRPNWPPTPPCHRCKLRGPTTARCPRRWPACSTAPASRPRRCRCCRHTSPTSQGRQVAAVGGVSKEREGRCGVVSGCHALREVWCCPLYFIIHDVLATPHMLYHGCRPT